MSELGEKVVAVVVVDLERTWLGTRSRSGDLLGGHPVLRRVAGKLLQVRGVGELVLICPESQMGHVWELIGPEDRVRVMALEPRPMAIGNRVRIGRAWNLLAWRGGAGQWTCFDEEYHSAAIAKACATAFEGAGAGHVLAVHSHSALLDVEITSALLHHHLHKNHEMRITYTPAAPGLSGLMLRADIVREMGEKQVMPWQLLGYDPKAPAFDTLIREACMQVDPAVSKIPNRFCVDTERSWARCGEVVERGIDTLSAAEICLAAARSVAPGVRDLSHVDVWPREVEVELTGERLTSPPGSVPEEVRRGRGVLDVGHWVRFFERQGTGEEGGVWDDLLVTVGGDGDPQLYDGLVEVLEAGRRGGALSICVQTDLAWGNVDPLLEAVEKGLVDVVSVTTYGQSAGTYARVAGADLFGAVMKNMERLAGAVQRRGGKGMPLVVPRLLKVRETIPEMEAFFDFWIERCGWAVIDGPTDRAGVVPFEGVVDMAPPKRRPCRRLWERMVIRANGMAMACDQDVRDHLSLGTMEGLTLRQMWERLTDLRAKHAAGAWAEVEPCNHCREWHRA